MARWRGGRTPPMPGVRRRFWPGPRPSAGVVREWIAAATGAPTTLAGWRSCKSSLDRARHIASRHSAFHWELAFPEVVLRRERATVAERRLRRGDRQSAVGRLRADIGSRPNEPMRNAPRRRRFAIAAPPAIGSQTSGHPNSYQLFLDRALQLTRRGGRVGLDPAVRHRDRSRQRGVAPPSVRSHVDRHLDRVRQSPPHFSDSSQRPVRRDGHDERRLDRDAEVPLRPDRSRRARSTRRRAARRWRLSRSRIESWSPEHLTIPEITSATALGIIDDGCGSCSGARRCHRAGTSASAAS